MGRESLGQGDIVDLGLEPWGMGLKGAGGSPPLGAMSSDHYADDSIHWEDIDIASFARGCSAGQAPHRLQCVCMQ